MTTRAAGAFDVASNPLPPYDTTAGASLGRMSLSKNSHGNLDVTSRVETLSGCGEVKGSAGYVAVPSLCQRRRDVDGRPARWLSAGYNPSRFLAELRTY
jgi:hypothetical protein